MIRFPGTLREDEWNDALSAMLGSSMVFLLSGEGLSVPSLQLNRRITDRIWWGGGGGGVILRNFSLCNSNASLSLYVCMTESLLFSKLNPPSQPKLT